MYTNTINATATTIPAAPAAPVPPPAPVVPTITVMEPNTLGEVVGAVLVGATVGYAAGKLIRWIMD